MSVNERIKMVRKELKLTQDQFAKQIGISASALSQIENGMTNASEQTLILVCERFRVIDEWLRYGEGEMFVSQDNSVLLGQFFGEILNDDDGTIRRRLITALAKLEPRDWRAIADMAERIIKDPE